MFFSKMNYLKIISNSLLFYFGVNLIYLLWTHYLIPYQYEKDYCQVKQNSSSCYSYSLMDNNLCLTLYEDTRDCLSYENNQIIECWRFKWKYQLPNCRVYFYESDVKEDIKKINKVFLFELEYYIFYSLVSLIFLKVLNILMKPSFKSNKNIIINNLSGKYYLVKRSRT